MRRQKKEPCLTDGGIWNCRWGSIHFVIVGVVCRRGCCCWKLGNRTLFGWLYNGIGWGRCGNINNGCWCWFFWIYLVCFLQRFCVYAGQIFDLIQQFFKIHFFSVPFVFPDFTEGIHSLCATQTQLGKFILGHGLVDAVLCGGKVVSLWSGVSYGIHFYPPTNSWTLPLPIQCSAGWYHCLNRRLAWQR